jgi:hypothetical protein
MATTGDRLHQRTYDELETIAHREKVQVKGTGRGGYPTRADLIRDIRAQRRGDVAKRREEMGGYKPREPEAEAGAGAVVSEG